VRPCSCYINRISPLRDRRSADDRSLLQRDRSDMASARDEENVTGDYVASFINFEDAMRDVKEHEDRTNFRFVITKTRKRGI